METLSFHSARSCYLVNYTENVVEKRLYSHHVLSTEQRVSCFYGKPDRGLFRYAQRGNLRLKKLSRGPFSRAINALKGAEPVIPSLLGSSQGGYVLDGEEGAGDVVGGILPKVLIPGLPDESKGEYAAPLSSRFREWKPKLNVHYEMSGSENISSPPVLFLPGFGVGSFHYEKQLKDLGRDHRAWALDFLGQGLSLPSEDPTVNSNASRSNEDNFLWGFGDEVEPWAEGLVYSIDLWKDQVRYFVEEVIKEPVYIVGNSLGGYVALYFASCYPQLVKGVTLLNATPFWGFLPNQTRSPRLSRMFPWAGSFPLPANIKKLTEILWQKISDPESIAEVLKQVYADHSIRVDNVFSSILEITKHPAAAASLASIMFAPRAELSFNEALSGCQENKIPVCLVYGKEDPWVRPIWGFQVKRLIPEAPYYEISPAGHCPHDEVPEVVNFLVRGWIRSLESQHSAALPLLDSFDSVKYDMARELEFIREGTKKSVKVQFYGSSLSLWSRLTSFLKFPIRYKRVSPQ